jgi:plasmid stability protein
VPRTRLTRSPCYTGLVALKNVTITLDEDVARWARIRAAERETSVSRLVGDLLREKMREDQSYESAMREYLARPGRKLKKAGARYPRRADLHGR